MSGEENRRRLPTNLTGLLQFALEQTRSEDAPNTSDYNDMDPERKAFLEKAFKSMTIDVITEFEKALVTLHDDKATIDNKEEALNLIRDHICQIDFANSFVKLGGDKMLMDYAKHPSFRLRRLAIAIIAEMSQNNPTCQKYFLEDNAIQLFVTYFLEQEELARSAIYAVSAIIRSYEPALAKFIEIGGIRALVVCMKRKEQKVFIKAAFLIGATANEFHSLRDKYVDEGALTYLFTCIDPVTDYDVKIETCLFTIASLSKSDHFKPTPEQKDSLYKLLMDLITACDDLPQCEEMVEYAKNIVDRLALK